VPYSTTADTDLHHNKRPAPHKHWAVSVSDYHGSFTVTQLLVWNLKNFRHLISIAKSATLLYKIHHEGKHFILHTKLYKHVRTPSYLGIIICLNWSYR
jgi:hypothetical protein